MCVILVGKIGEALHRQAKAQNPDGFSLFTLEQGLVKDPTPSQVRKALNTFGIWHYRIASSGKVDKNNIHPFPVARGKAYLYHNGVLGAGTDKYSDTNCLAQTLYDCPLNTVKSVLESLSSGQRLLLANAKDPRKFYLYGDWKVESGILMSHKMYTSYGSVAQKAGWVTRDESCYGGITRYLSDEPHTYADDEVDWKKVSNV